MTSKTAALANIGTFEAGGPPDVAWGLDRAATLARLRTLVNDPDKLDQRGLNACAPAVFFRIWLSRDPVAAATFACTLLNKGEAPIGALMISPDDDLLNQDYNAVRSTTHAAHPNSMPETADWMLLSALRDSENAWFDYLGEPYTWGDQVAGITLPSSLSQWLTTTGMYSGGSVRNDTSVVAGGDWQALLNAIPTSNVDIVLFVAAKVLYGLSTTAPIGGAPARDLISVPDHYILLTGPCAQWSDPAWLKVDLWSWGKPYQGWQGAEFFASNYFGMITASTT